MLVFLAGKIDGLSWDEANGWREKASFLLKQADENIKCYNPLKNVPDLYGKEVLYLYRSRYQSDAIAANQFYIKKADIILVNLERIDAKGTYVEIGFARALDKIIVAFGKDNKNIFFIQKWVTIFFNTLEEAVNFILDLERGGM